MLRFNLKRLSTKLPALIIGAAAISAVTIGVMSYRITAGNSREMLDAQIDSVVESARGGLLNYFGMIEQDLRSVAALPDLVSILKGFRQGWDAFGEASTTQLQAAYISGNPHPTGEKEKLVRGNSNVLYDSLHEKHHPWFRTILQERQYYDIFLIDADGNVLYTVFKELDFATNLNNGKWRDSDLANAYRSAIASDTQGSIHFFDFKAYAPSHGAAASFMATPIVENGKAIGVLAFQMPIKVINEYMGQSEGLGETGELLLVGSDYLMRNDSRFTEVDDLLQTRIENPAIEAALAGSHELVNATGYRDALLNYQAFPLSYRGENWAIVAAKDVAEIEAPLNAMRNQLFMLALSVLVVVALVGFVVSRRTTGAIGKLVSEMTLLAGGDTSVALASAERADEIGDMTRAVAVFRDNTVNMKRLEAEQEESKRRAEEEASQMRQRMAADFEAAVGSIVTAVSNSAEELRSSAQIMTTSSEETSARSITVASAAEEASGNVQTVASAAEELASSIEEISRQVATTTGVVGNATSHAEETNQRIGGLSEASQRIGDVVKLISDIAEQTNLLALNATIEAARAGEAGKGFAVVAAEVKELATQTAKATEEISSQITDIQDSTGEAVGAIKTISKIMAEVSQYTSAIAAAVEEQGAATAEISRNVQEAAQGTTTVAQNIAGVSDTVSETNQTASHVLHASEALKTQADDLRGTVDQFLKKIATA